MYLVLVEQLIALTMSLALVGLLVLYAPRMRETLSGSIWGDTLLGCIFGLVVVAEMLHPVEPMPGLIIDLRALPLVLAGAFLNWKGVVATIVIGIAARMAVGGVGAPAGAISTVMYAAAGVFWAKTPRSVWPNRTVRYLALPTASCAGIFAGAFLPDPSRSWFFLNAAPSLAVIYFITLPPLAFTLERALQSHSKHLLLDLETFRHRIRAKRYLSAQDEVVAVFSATIDCSSELSRHSHVHPADVLDAIAHDVHDRLPFVRFLGQRGEDTLLVPLTRDQLIDLDATRSALRPVFAEGRLRLPDGTALSFQAHFALWGADLVSRYAIGDGVPGLGNDPRRLLFAKANVLSRPK